MTLPNHGFFRVVGFVVGGLIAAGCAGTTETNTGMDAGHLPLGGDAGVDSAAIVPVADRAQGVRAPRSAACDPTDSTLCLLPWPSDVYTVADGTTATGLRLALHPSSVAPGDDVTGINLANGFSRATPLMTAFPHPLDPSSLGDGITGALRVVVSEPGTDFGTLVPMRLTVTAAGEDSPAVEGYPRRPFDAASEHVAVVMDSLHTTDGSVIAPDSSARIALGLEAPVTPADEALRAYHAPTRAALTHARIDPNHVLRVWTFTTRSADDASSTLTHMRTAEISAVAAGSVSVTITSVQIPTSGTVAAIVLGTMHGLPNFVGSNGTITRAADGTPMAAVGAPHDALFRVAIPRGTGNYPVLMYGHGTGGDVTDSSFDDVITAAGLAKVSMQFRGWTGADLPNTFGALTHMLAGVDQSTSLLEQSLADGMASLAAMGTTEAMGHSPIADAIAAPTLMDSTNPAAGRRPDATRVVWAGGSLGGTLGFVFSCAEPHIQAGVLNVPGAAWTHFVTGSTLFVVARLALRVTYTDDLQMWLAVAESQGNWDGVDGVAWFPHAGTRPFLLQESMGDPVLPNIGNEFAAAALGAIQVGAVLNPVWGAPHADAVTGHTALTQYRVPHEVTAPLDIHGFAARDTPAGVAARAQIFNFLSTALAGTAQITIPPTCQTNTPAGSCDFSAQ